MTPSFQQFAADDLFGLRWALEPAHHPLSPAVAFVVSGPDRTSDDLGYELFVTDEPGGDARAIDGVARRPRWSPSGDQIAFLRRSDGRWGLACRVADGTLCDVGEPLADVTDFDWAPDGTRWVCVTTEPADVTTRRQPYLTTSVLDWVNEPRTQLRLITLDGGDEELLPTWKTDDAWGARWSPSDNRIAFLSNRGVDREASTASGIWLCDVTTGTTECIVEPSRPIRAVAWSADARKLAYLAARADNAASAQQELWVVDLDTRIQQQLAPELDRSIGLPVRGDDERGIGSPLLEWSSDSLAIFAIFAEGGRSRLARFPLAGGWHEVVGGDRCILEFSLDRSSSAIAFSWSDSSTPGEVAVFQAETGSELPISSVSLPLVTDRRIAPTQSIVVTASDGVDIEGWFTIDPAAGPDAPLVVQVHGGPHYPVGSRFSFDAQRLAARGFGVLRANPRGSVGYGAAFAEGNLGDWGGRDLQDLIDLIDETVTSAGLDRDRVGIIGESYGGYMAAWAAASSDRFAVVVAENAIVDFVSSSGGVVGPRFWHSELGGAPWERPDVYVGRSPILRIDNVTVPVLVIHCEADTTCPVAQGEALYSALRSLGREVEFLRVPDEGHFFNVFGVPSRRIQRTKVLDEFLVRHLKPAQVPAYRKESGL